MKDNHTSKLCKKYVKGLEASNREELLWDELEKQKNVLQLQKTIAEQRLFRRKTLYVPILSDLVFFVSIVTGDFLNLASKLALKSRL
jgi:hypothetical protein